MILVKELTVCTSSPRPKCRLAPIIAPWTWARSPAFTVTCYNLLPSLHAIFQVLLANSKATYTTGPAPGRYVPGSGFPACGPWQASFRSFFWRNLTFYIRRPAQGTLHSIYDPRLFTRPKPSHIHRTSSIFLIHR